MTRVYLMADFGKGPRVRVTFPEKAMRPPIPAGYLPGYALDKIEGSRRWWLVRCQSAKQGRAIISDPNWSNDNAKAAGMHSRILDSGGAP